MTSHYLNQWWHRLPMHICVTWHQWVNNDLTSRDHHVGYLNKIFKLDITEVPASQNVIQSIHNVWYCSAGTNFFWRMSHGRMVNMLATAVDGKMCLWDSEVMDLKLCSNSWSNWLIIGISYTLGREYRVIRNRYSRLLFTSEDRLCANLHVREPSTNMTSQC